MWWKLSSSNKLNLKISRSMCCWIVCFYFRHLKQTQFPALNDEIDLYSWKINISNIELLEGGGPRVVVSTAAFHAGVRGSVPVLGEFKESKMFLPHPRVKLSIVESLRDREVACSASDSNPVSGGQCHFIHLTILRRFSWPSLAYMCTKVA